MARTPSFRDRAFVVRTYDFGEADRVVVLLTRDHGLVRSVAKGVRKTRSRFGSRIQPFVNIDVQLYPGRNLATITQADTVTYYGAGIIDDFERYTAACAVLETAEKLSYADLPDASLFDATAAALHTLQDAEYPHSPSTRLSFALPRTPAGACRCTTAPTVAPPARTPRSARSSAGPCAPRAAPRAR